MQMTKAETWEGRPAGEWQRLWNLPVLEIFQSLDSTNDRLKTLSAGGTEAWTTVVSEAQTRGRGRGGRVWHSPSGKGLWVSLLVPSQGPEADALLPVRVGLSVAGVLDRAGPRRDGGPDGILLKWPNDLLLEGRKVGGILCEAVGSDGVVVGLGLNVGQAREDFPASLRDTAISLQQAWRCGISRGALLGEMIADVRRAHAGATHRLRRDELEAYAARDALLGHPVRSELEGRGVGAGITARGFLILRKESGIRLEIRGGSVERLAR